MPEINQQPSVHRPEDDSCKGSGGTDALLVVHVVSREVAEQRRRVASHRPILDVPPHSGDESLDDWLAEECDAGAANANTPDAPCRPDCTLPRCGDGVQDSTEGCDEGEANSADGSCGADCQLTCVFQDSEIMNDAQCQALAGYYGDARQQWNKSLLLQ